MKIETETRDDHQIKIIAESDDATLESFKQKASRKISRESKIPGFRPGKAPHAVIRRIYGDELIQKEAIEMLIDDLYPKAIEETKVKPYGPGALDQIISEAPPRFSFIVPLEPELKLSDYHQLRQDYTVPTIEQQQVDDYILHLRKSYATVEPVERATEKGDLVYLKFNGTVKDPKDGEDAEVFKDIPSQVIIDDLSAENDFPFEKFDQQVIGLKANEEKVISHAYSANTVNEKLAGKTVDFKITIQSVKSLHLPEINDEFAKLVGGFENVDVLKSTIRKQLEATAKNDYDRKYFDEVIEKIRKESEVKYPPQALKDEVEHVLNSITTDLASKRLDLETYLKTIKKEKDVFIKEDVTPIATKRLEQSLIFEEIARQEKIKLDENELHDAFSQTIQELQVTPDFQKMQRKLSPQRLSNAIAMQAANRLISNHVLDRLKLIATGQYVKPEEETKPADDAKEPSATAEVTKDPAEEGAKPVKTTEIKNKKKKAKS